MERAQQLASLRSALREAFPNSLPSQGSHRRLHGMQAGLTTGVECLDRLLAGQGLPRGRISEITGERSSGKTGLLMRVLAMTTRGGSPVAYIDSAGAFFPPTALAAGVDLKRVLLVRPKTLADALKAADIILRGQAFPLVIFDWATDPPRGELRMDPGAAIARLNGLCSLGEAALLFLTSPTTARDALRYYATVRLEVSRSARHGGAPSMTSALAVAASSPSPPQVIPISMGPGPSPATSPATPDRRLKLVGLPTTPEGAGLCIAVVKNKLAAPGGQLEVALDGLAATRLPLHPGLPHSGASTA